MLGRLPRITHMLRVFREAWQQSPMIPEVKRLKDGLDVLFKGSKRIGSWPHF